MSWKDNATIVKQNIFLHADDTNSIYYPKVLPIGLKTRPVDEKGVYKSNVIYEISSDVFKPLAEAWAKKNNLNVTRDNIAEILGIDDRIVMYYNDENSCGSHDYTLYYLARSYNIWKDDEHWYKKDFTLRFAVFKEMKLLTLTNKENAIKKQQELIKRKVALNNLILKDNITAAFKKHGYLLETYDDKKYRLMYNPGSKDYDAFIEAAIDHYINGVLLKDLGCKIHVPKPSSRKGTRSVYDSIIDMESIDIEGEQNGSENINR